jgi:hypothetical protein
MLPYQSTKPFQIPLPNLLRRLQLFPIKSSRSRPMVNVGLLLNPLPFPLQHLTNESRTGGPIEGYTCTGSQHGVCCSQYGYCGNRPEYCYAGCQTGFGYCLGENEAHPQVAGPEPFVLSIVGTATDISVVTWTTTATAFLTETETVTVTATAAFTSLPVSARSSQKMFKRYPRRNAAAYANM